MPAIEFSRLRTKIELLGTVYDRPGQFIKDLTDLYFFYSDLTFLANNPNVPANVHPAYRAPAIINRELERAFRPLTASQPDQTLIIIDQLWSTGVMEPCQLAAALLGDLPLSHADGVLERIQEWTLHSKSPEMIETLHSRGTQTIRRENQSLWMDTLNRWHASRETVLNKYAVLGLLPMLEDASFSNLPIVFDFLQPMIEDPDPKLVYTLLNLIEKLQQISEPETVFFLKQIIKTSKSPTLPRFIRRALPSFTDEAQSSLKTCLREYTQS